MQPFLTVIVPVYGIGEKLLRACLESLLAQDCDDYCIIAVDDGTPDNGGIICDEYAMSNARLTVIHQENSGVSAARNRGLDAAVTDWVLFVDPDDWVEPDLVSTLKKVADDGEADIVLFDYYQEFASRQVENCLRDHGGKLDDEWVNALRLAPFNNFIVHGVVRRYETNTVWNKMYRLNLIRANGIRFEPDARKGQDVIFNAETLQFAETFIYVRAALYHYRYLKESITNRFNPSVNTHNSVAFREYERIIRERGLPEEYVQAFHVRVVTRLYSSMRVYFFHPENDRPIRLVYRELNAMLDSHPFRVALDRADPALMFPAQRVFVVCLKMRAFRLLRVLVQGRQLLQRMRGMRLA